MVTGVQRYHRASSAAEAYELKREAGERAAYLAGGTDVMVHRPRNIEILIDLRHAGLDAIRLRESRLLIGAAAPLYRVEEAVCSVAGGILAAAVRENGPWLIRNVATLAGNIANASPAADSVPALLALDAQLHLVGETAERVPLAAILEGPHRTVLGNRLIEAIEVPLDAQRRGHFHKLARSASDIAQVNVAVTARWEGDRFRQPRIVLGAVAPVPMRARQAEALLEGNEVTETLLREVAQVAGEETRPLSDWRASADYRRRTAGVLVYRALQALVDGGREAC